MGTSNNLSRRPKPVSSVLFFLDSGFRRNDGNELFEVP